MIRLPRIGQILSDRYVILEKLGSGGFSEIYLARNKSLPNYPHCVIKYLRPTLGNSLRAKITRRFFEREAKILDQLGRDYDQIPTFHAYYPAEGPEVGQVYLVQEYIQGDRLDQWMAATPRISPKAVIRILLEILAILKVVHGHQIIHHDIKPSNIIRRHSDGKLVLMDFGASCYLPQRDRCYNAEGEPVTCVIGTMGYMPQEQDRGEFHLSSDLYALGILGIHLLTRIPVQDFPSNKQSGELEWRHFVKAVRPNHRLLDILDRMVRVDYRDRYPTAQAVVAELEPLTHWHTFIKKHISTPFKHHLKRHIIHRHTVDSFIDFVARGDTVTQPFASQSSLVSQPICTTPNRSPLQKILMASTTGSSPTELFPPECC